jgi:hypothetical protein
MWREFMVITKALSGENGVHLARPEPCTPLLGVRLALQPEFPILWGHLWTLSECVQCLPIKSQILAAHSFPMKTRSLDPNR